MPTWEKEPRFFKADCITNSTQLEILDDGQSIVNKYGDKVIKFHVQAYGLNGQGAALEDGVYLWEPNQTQGSTLAQFWGSNTSDWKSKRFGFQRRNIDFGSSGTKNVAVPVLLTAKGK